MNTNIAKLSVELTIDEYFTIFRALEYTNTHVLDDRQIERMCDVFRLTGKTVSGLKL